MQSYILAYYRLRKKEPLIALGSHCGGLIKDEKPKKKYYLKGKHLNLQSSQHEQHTTK
jgi:hypothetical protein